MAEGGDSNIAILLAVEERVQELLAFAVERFGAEASPSDWRARLRLLEGLSAAAAAEERVSTVLGGELAAASTADRPRVTASSMLARYRAVLARRAATL